MGLNYLSQMHKGVFFSPLLQKKTFDMIKMIFKNHIGHVACVVLNV
jgi:hypothetical protein